MNIGRSELDKVRARYDRRKSSDMDDRYSAFRPVNILYRQERERAITSLLGKWLGTRKLSDCQIAEIGCGSGTNLLQMVTFGAAPQNLTANELLEERIIVARSNLPAAVRFLSGDASTIAIGEGSLDIVIQSTVFSSILDSVFRKQLAMTMLKWLKPGGCVLWYDLTFDNPSNSDITGIPLAEVRRLFPGCDISQRRVTLAPPLARRLGMFTTWIYPVLNAFPFLRTHVVCMIRKP